MTEDTCWLTSYFSFFLPTFSMAYVVSRVCLCRFTMFHIQTTFCQANRFGTKQPSTSYRHATLNLWYLVFWQVYIRRSYQAYELTTLYHEKVPFFSFLSFPPHSYRIVMLVTSDCRVISISIGPMREYLSYQLHVCNCILQIEENVLVVQFQFILPNAHPNRFVRCDTSGAIRWPYSRRKKCKFRLCDTERSMRSRG